MTSATRLRVWVLVAMTLANAMVLVDQTAVPLALPDIMSEFGVGSQQAQWVINASLLPLAGLLVLGGRLADLLGARRVFLVGTVLFAGASAAGGLAPTYDVLVLLRVAQGVGGALMLPTSVAMVSAAYPGAERGRALGLMGGAAAVAGAMGPVIGGVLTSAFSWRAVLLINVPLAVVAVVVTLLAVPRPRRGETAPGHVDLLGALLLSVTLIGVVYGVSQSQVAGWSDPGVVGPVLLAAAAGVAFVLWERRTSSPLMDFALLRRHPHYLGGTLSQGMAGMAEMGLGVLFPLLLILNLGMDPGLAGLALLPASLPMVLVAPLAGRWYDQRGGRPPLVVGFLVLAASGVLLAVAVQAHSYWLLLPGFFVYGVGLAIVLTVNDPVSLDQVDEADHGQASGVSATAEQFGGAFGIALLYLVFHTVFVQRLHDDVDASPLADLTPAQYEHLREVILAAETTGLTPATFDPEYREYLTLYLNASNWGMAAAFLTVSVISVAAAVLLARLIRRGRTPDRPAATAAPDAA